MQARFTWLALLATMPLALAAGCGGGAEGDSGESPTASIEATDGGAADTPGAGQTSPDGAATRQDNVHPTVIVHTNMGDFTLRLDAEHAPLTVDNFLTYANTGHYNGTVFHRVEPGYIVLGGGYGADMVEKPTRPPIRNEARNGLSNRRGTIAMARVPDIIDSSTSHFFINLADNSSLDYRGEETAEDYGYCVFGEIVSGFEVIEKISQSPSQSRQVQNPETGQPDVFDLVPVEPVVVESIQRVN